MSRLRPVICLVFGLALATLMAACAGNGAEDAADAEAPQEPDTTVAEADGSASQEPTSMATESVPELDLDTLQAETEFGTAQAERAANSYVGSIGEGRAIGIALLDNDSGGDQDSKRQIVVYLYDGDDLAEMVGGVDASGTGTLESGDLSDFDAGVEVTVDGDTVSGTATFPGERPAPYTADAATGVAGVYWADGTDEDPEASCHWVILSDGRQWGCACIPPFTNPCCHLF